MKKIVLILLFSMLLFACTAKKEDSLPVEEKIDIDQIPVEEEIDVDQVYASFDRAFRYVHQNFYFSTPHWDLDPDYGHCDENYACLAKNYETLEEFKSHIMNDYDLTERFSDELININLGQALYEKEDGLYVIDADRGSRIDVGNEIARELVKVSDDQMILRVTYEKISIETEKVEGSFDVDNILVLVDGLYLWDNIPTVY